MTGSLVPFPTPQGGGGAATGGQNILDRKGVLKGAYQPSAEIKKRWKVEGQRREDPGYTLRWIHFWGRVVRALACLGHIGTTELIYVEQYVQHCRLAEMHLSEAERDPYQTYESSGYIAAHPGFSQARAEVKLARALASDLGLTPAVRRAAGVEVPRAESSAAQSYVDDQEGL